MGLARFSPARLMALPAGRSRGLVLASFIDWGGTGVWLSTSTVLMVRIVHLTATQVGLGLTVGGVLGLAAVWPVTMATRRWPARWVAMTVQLLRGLFFLSFLAVHSAPAYYLAAALVAIVDRPATSVNQVLVSRYVPDSQRAGTLAAMHVATNAGVMLGALVASVALLVPSRASLDAVVIANSLSFLVAAWQMRVALRRRREQRRILRERRVRGVALAEPEVVLTLLLPLHRSARAVDLDRPQRRSRNAGAPPDPIDQRAGDARGAAEACESLARSSMVRDHQLLAWYDAGRIWSDDVRDDDRAIVALEAAVAIDVAHEDVFDRLSRIYAGRRAASPIVPHKGSAKMARALSKLRRTGW